MEMDSLSKVNSHLHETNKKLEIEVQQLKIKQEEDYEQIKKLKKKNRKCQEMIDNFPNEKDLQSIIQLNTRLQNDNHLLQEEVAELQEKMRNAKTHR
jgi:predicted CopG family antitoxin